MRGVEGEVVLVGKVDTNARPDVARRGRQSRGRWD